MLLGGGAALLALFLALAAAETAPEPEKPGEFPAGFLGLWEGELSIRAAGGDDHKARRVPMTLAVAATDAPDRWEWRIRYDDQPERRYHLLAVDAAAGRYAIDEGNSIVLPAIRFGDELISDYAVAGNRLVIRWRTSGESVTFSAVVTPAAASGRTGGREGVPEVETFAPAAVQSADLRRAP